MIKTVATTEWMIARALFRTIYLGLRFHGLDDEVKAAVIAHEEGHIKGHHSEWRLVCLLLCFPLLPLLCRQQEIWADAYATRIGHGPALLKLLQSEYNGGFLNPSHAKRRSMITLALSS